MVKLNPKKMSKKRKDYILTVSFIVEFFTCASSIILMLILSSCADALLYHMPLTDGSLTAVMIPVILFLITFIGIYILCYYSPVIIEHDNKIEKQAKKS